LATGKMKAGAKRLHTSHDHECACTQRREQHCPIGAFHNMGRTPIRARHQTYRKPRYLYQDTKILPGRARRVKTY
jgi:hypothetical protein